MTEKMNVLVFVCYLKLFGGLFYGDNTIFFLFTLLSWKASLVAFVYFMAVMI